MRAIMISAKDLRTIPLFQGLADAHLDKLVAIFERQKLPAGEVLFRAGDAPRHLLLLVSGEVTLTHEGEPRFRLVPFAPIGELGALSGLERNTTATTSVESEVWRVPVPALMKFFAEHGDVAFPFLKSLLDIVADKVRRDELRLEDMRKNLVRTQKAMKALRDEVLEMPETPVSKAVVDRLDDLIETNRRGHYRVAPRHALATKVRLDDGRLVPVSEMSDGVLCVEGALPAKTGESFSAVLVLPSRELPISGKVAHQDGDGATVKLDLFIPEYEQALGEHLTRVQMLDFVV
jgi:CRP/FNR family transcriptional regulator, cyclic AMP receptor protein